MILLSVCVDMHEYQYSRVRKDQHGYRADSLSLHFSNSHRLLTHWDCIFKEVIVGWSRITHPSLPTVRHVVGPEEPDVFPPSSQCLGFNSFLLGMELEWECTHLDYRPISIIMRDHHGRLDLADGSTVILARG